MAVELLYHVKTTVKETLAAGVDAVITNDPRILGLAGYTRGS